MPAWIPRRSAKNPSASVSDAHENSSASSVGIRRPPTAVSRSEIDSSASGSRVPSARIGWPLTRDGTVQPERAQDRDRDVDRRDDAVQARRRRLQLAAGVAREHRADRQQLRHERAPARLHDDQHVGGPAVRDQAVERRVALVAGRQAGDDEAVIAQQELDAVCQRRGGPEGHGRHVALDVGGGDGLRCACGRARRRTRAAGQRRRQQAGLDLRERRPRACERLVPVEDEAAAVAADDELQVRWVARLVDVQRRARPGRDVEQRLLGRVAALGRADEPERELRARRRAARRRAPGCRLRPRAGTPARPAAPARRPPARAARPATKSSSTSTAKGRAGWSPALSLLRGTDIAVAYPV